MNPRALRVVLTSALFAAVFGLALREAVLTRRATASLASVLDRELSLEAELSNKERLLGQGARRRADLNARIEALRAARDRMASYDDQLRILAVAAKPWREIVLERDAKLQALYLESERAALPLRYAAFVSATGLSHEVAGKLEAEELAAAERALDIKAAAQAQGLAQTDPGVASILGQSDQELKGALTDLLGADSYAQLQQYERTLPTRSFVDALAGQLAFTDSPLSAEQADQLVSELVSANSSYQSGGPAVSPRLVNYNSVMATQSQAQEPVAWDSIRSQAQSTLSEAQFALLDASMQDNRTTIQLYNMMKQDSDAPMLGFSYYLKTP